ncbi:MAG: hypothetical protein ACOCRK_02785 [bacterium]
MENQEIKQHIINYLNEDNQLKKDIIYMRYLNNFVSSIIDSALANYNQYDNNSTIDVDTDELRQLIFMKLFRSIFSLKKLEKINNIKSYSFIISKNYIIDEIRKTKTYRNKIKNIIDDDELDLHF